MLIRGKTSWALMLALAVFACSGGGSSPTSGSSSSGGGGQVVTVEVRDFEFSPKSIVIQPGQTVRWVQRGNDPTHTTTERDGVWDSGQAFRQDGATFEHTFGAQDEGRAFNYRCSSHQACCQMQGSVRVGSNAPPPDQGY